MRVRWPSVTGSWAGIGCDGPRPFVGSRVVGYALISLGQRDNVAAVIRTQISLTEDQMRRLRSEARRRRVPIAEVVRDAVDRVVPADPDGRRARIERLLAAAGRFHSGTGDVAARHDEIAGEGEW